MSLVPTDMLGHMQATPILTQLSTLDNDMSAILKNKDLPTDAKFRQYQGALQRYQMLVRKRDKVPRVEKKKSLPKDQLLDMPNYRKGKANILYQFIENIPELTVNERNEIQINGKTIQNSNIVDIFAALTLDRKMETPPRGFQEFFELLRRHNVPLEAIGNQRWRNELTSSSSSTTSDRNTSSSPFTTSRRGSPSTPSQFRLSKTFRGTNRRKSNDSWTPSASPTTSSRRSRSSPFSAASTNSSKKQRRGSNSIAWQNVDYSTRPSNARNTGQHGNLLRGVRFDSE